MTQERTPTEFDLAYSKITGDPIPGEREITKETLDEMISDAAENYDPLEHKTLDELKEVEEDDEDAIIAEYRRKRIEEMKQKAMAEKFGGIQMLTEVDYEEQVTNAKDVDVVVFLYEDGNPHCDLMHKCLLELSRKNKAVKFVKIYYKSAIKTYPEKNLPTLLVYRDGDIKDQLITLADVGGNTMTTDDLEWYLARKGTVSTDLEEDPREARRSRVNLRREGRGKRYDSSDSDDSDY